jgi:hypothetical protein
VLAAELAVPAAAVLCCVAAGSATAIAAATATLATPAPAVTAASLVLPLRRRCLALASSASAGSRSDDDIGVLQSVVRSVCTHCRARGSAGRADNLSRSAELSESRTAQSKRRF